MVTTVPVRVYVYLISGTLALDVPHGRKINGVPLGRREADSEELASWWPASPQQKSRWFRAL